VSVRKEHYHTNPNLFPREPDVWAVSAAYCGACGLDVKLNIKF